MGRDLAFGKFTDGALKMLLFVGQREFHGTSEGRETQLFADPGVPFYQPILWPLFCSSSHCLSGAK